MFSSGDAERAGDKNALARIRTEDLILTKDTPYQLGHESSTSCGSKPENVAYISHVKNACIFNNKP